MEKVQSKDGTLIAFERTGEGPPLILVDGALCYRASGPMTPLAAALAQNFSVITYDRRGRGDSGDTLPYSLDREVEDLEALINAAGGSAFVCGVSSGAALALEAANRGLSITKLALYEPPFIVDDSRPPISSEFVTRMKELVSANRRADAVKHFMKAVGVPAFVIPMMRLMPAWPKLTGVAHTLVYDVGIVAENQQGKPLPGSRWSSTTVPTLVIAGGKSPAWMRNAMKQLVSVLPNARLLTLEGQTHMVKAKATAPALIDFFDE